MKSQSPFARIELLEEECARLWKEEGGGTQRYWEMKMQLSTLIQCKNFIIEKLQQCCFSSDSTLPFVLKELGISPKEST